MYEKPLESKFLGGQFVYKATNASSQIPGGLYTNREVK